MICERNHVIGAGSSDEILNSLEEGPTANGNGGGGSGDDCGGLVSTTGVYSSHFDDRTSLCRCGSKEGITEDFMPLDTVERMETSMVLPPPPPPPPPHRCLYGTNTPTTSGP